MRLFANIFRCLSARPSGTLQGRIAKEHLRRNICKGTFRIYTSKISSYYWAPRNYENQQKPLQYMFIYTNIKIKFQIFCVLDSDSLENLPILNYLKSSVAESFVLEILKSILLLPGTRLLYNGIVIIISASSYIMKYH